MRAPLLIAIWLALFFAWLWIMNRVNKEFWYTGRADLLLSMTFYTGGIVGVFLLLGRQNRSPILARWVEEILESKPAESIGIWIAGREKAAAFRENLTSIWKRVRKEPDEEYTTVSLLDDDDSSEPDAAETGRSSAKAASPDAKVAVRAERNTRESFVAPDMLELTVKKALDSGIDVIHLEPLGSKLAVKYLTESGLETDRILAEEFGAEILSVLNSKLDCAPRPSQRAELLMDIDGRAVPLDITRGTDDGEVIILTFPGGGA